MLDHVSDTTLRIRAADVERHGGNDILDRFVTDYDVTDRGTVSMGQDHTAAPGQQRSDLFHGRPGNVLLLVDGAGLAHRQYRVSPQCHDIQVLHERCSR